MTPHKTPLLLLCLFLLQQTITAQNKTGYKFANIPVKDFAPQSSAIDSGCNAVVLADVGSSEFEGNTKGNWTLVYKRRKRMLLKSRNAFDQATISVLLYTGAAEYEEKFEDFEASTYNVENGQVTESKIVKTAVFKEKVNKDYTRFKFTLPSIKEGSIIDYKYTLRSPFKSNDIRPWTFQGEYPVLWTEYKVTIPPFFKYAIFKQGYLPFSTDTAGRIFKTYSIVESGGAGEHSEVYSLSGDATWATWGMKEVPAFKAEGYISASKNYISRIKFQLHSIHYSDSYSKQIMKDWFSLSEDLMKDPDFGLSLSDQNGWSESELKNIIGNESGREKAKRIFEYVRDNYTCIDDDAIYLSQPIKKTFQLKKGNVADLNLLLSALLIAHGFDAHPVLLSTRDNGWPSDVSAILSQFNYVITRVKVDSAFYLLDASVNRLGFGKLPTKCYNGNGRLIDNPPVLVSLSPDSLTEQKSTLLFVVNDEKEGVSGSVVNNCGYYESLAIRNKIAKEKQDDYFKELGKGYSSDIQASNFEIDSLKTLDMPVSVRYDIKMKFDEDIVYFNPILTESWKQNPFASAERYYPVEMSSKINETYVLNMEVPKGYKIDELPKSARINLNDNEGMFEYLIQGDAANIQFRCRLVLNKTNFVSEDYKTLRDFFTFVVKKEAEQIVFKKN